jgi:IS4 transposase
MLTINTPIVIDSQRIADLVITAFEGGSNHWIQKVERIAGTANERPWYSDPLLYDGVFHIRIWADGSPYELTTETAKRGFVLMAEQYQSTHWADFLEESEDADTADVWLQLSVLGDVVYG